MKLSPEAERLRSRLLAALSQPVVTLRVVGPDGGTRLVQAPRPYQPVGEGVALIWNRQLADDAQGEPTSGGASE